MKKTTQFLLLGASSLLFTACDRPQNTAKIRIQLPSQSKDAKPSPVAKRSGKVSAQGGGGSDWGQPIPNSINDFNCYAVFIGGPEADMRDKACIKGSGSSFEKFYFHNMVGFRPAGQTIEVDVKPGAGRKFYVLGVKSNINGCQSLENPDNIDQSQHSNPLVVGTKTADLVAGNNSITIDASLDTDISSQLLQGCSFFGGTGGAPDRIDLRGPISSYDGSPSSALGWSTCNRVRLELRSQDGDPLLDSPLSVSLNVSSSFGTVGAFHSNENCSSSEITSTSISPGEYFKDVFFKASPTYGTGAVSISAVVGAGTIHAHRNIDIGYASSATNIQFMDSELRLAANTCADVFYWPVAGNRSASNTVGSIGLSAFDLAGNTQSLGSLSGSAFLDHCAGSPISGVGPTGHTGKFSFRMGSLAQDFQIGSQTSPQALMQVNVEPKAHHLHISAADMSPYASECTEITVQARTAANTPADLSGNDLSPFSLIKRIRAQIYPLNPNSARGYYNDACTIDKTDSNTTILEANNSSISEFYTFSTTGTAAIRVWGGEFLSGNNESFLMMTPRWDPGALRTPANAVSFFRPSGSLGSNYLPKVSYNSLFPSLTVNGASIVMGTLGTGNHAIQLDTNQYLSASSLWGFSQFTYGFLFKPSYLPVSNQIISLKDFTSNELGSLVTTGTLANYIKLVGHQAGVSAFTDSVPLSPDAWSSLVVSRGAGNCRLYINAVEVASVACDTISELSTAEIGHSSSGVPSLHGEFFITDRALSAGEISQYYNYLRNRYPSANLGDIVPAPFDIPNFSDNSGNFSLTDISAPVTVRALATSTTAASLQYSKNGQAWVNVPLDTPTDISLMKMELIEFRVWGPTASTASVTLTNVSNGNTPLDTFTATVSDVCLVSPAVGDTCLNGSIFLGYRSGFKYMMTPGGCDNSSTPTCSGGLDGVTKSWDGGSSTTGATGAEQVSSSANSSTAPGDANTEFIINAGIVDNTSAAHFCSNMEYGGHNDWFLPSKSELAWMYCLSNPDSHNTANPVENPNCTSFGALMRILNGFNSAFYWSSTEGSDSTAHTVHFGTGQQSMPNRSTSVNHYVRCVRRVP